MMTARPCREGDIVIRMACRCSGSIFVLLSQAAGRGRCSTCRGLFTAVGDPVVLGPGGSHPVPAAIEAVIGGTP